VMLPGATRRALASSRTTTHISLIKLPGRAIHIPQNKLQRTQNCQSVMSWRQHAIARS
jgi:uncharacterized membrane protein